MKRSFYLLLLFCWSVTFIISCNNKKADKQQEVKVENQHKIVVKYIGWVRSRKSYSHIQFMKDQKQIDAYLKKQYASNPTIGYQPDSISKYLVSQFEKLDLIKSGELLLQNFKKQTDEKTTYTDSSGREVSLVFYINQLTGHYNFKLLSVTDSVDIDTGGTNLQDLDYAFIDVIPGGNKELVYLDDYYVMNGDNFDFKIYEIKIN